MRKKITTLILGSLTIGVSLQLNAQIHEQSFEIGGIYEDEGRVIQIDGYKNTYIAGSYVNLVDFDPSPALADTAFRQTAFAPNAFIAKYDSTGDFKWVNTIDGQQLIHIRDMELSAAGDLYVIGDFMDTARFKGVSSLNTHVSNGVFDVFIAKYDTSGQILWSHSMGGVAPDWGYDLTVDQNENVIITGSFLVSMDFDPSTTGTANISTTMGSPDIFIAKYDANGDYLWAKKAGSPSMDEGHSIDVNRSGEIYVTGFIGDSSGFDTIGVANRGANDIFIAKYDAQGNAIWAQGLGGPAPDKGTVIKENGSNFYLAASYQALAFIDSSASAPNHFSAGAEDMLIASFDTSGAYQWSKSIGGLSSEEINSLDLDIHGNILISGSFADSANFDPDAGVAALHSNGDKDIFMAKYYPDGKYIWAHSFGAANVDEGNYILAANDAIYLTGAFEDTVDFNPSPTANDTLFASDNGSLFFAKFGACHNNHSFDTTSVCFGDSVIYNSQYSFNESGSFHLRMIDANGCDTLVTLFVEESDSINTQLTSNDPTIILSDSTSMYQWYDCNADTIISGETSHHFTASANGNYSAIITDSLSGCSDTTACVNITAVGIQQNEIEKTKLLLYPNPTLGNIYIESDQDVNYKIFNQLGQLVQLGRLKEGVQEISLHKLNSGIYFLSTEKQSQTSFHKIVLQK